MFIFVVICFGWYGSGIWIVVVEIEWERMRIREIEIKIVGCKKYIFKSIDLRI